MTEKQPEPSTPPREPLVLPSNSRDVTAERIGTVNGISLDRRFEGNEAGMTDAE
jgi:hypothetical protein